MANEKTAAQQLFEKLGLTNTDAYNKPRWPKMDAERLAAIEAYGRKQFDDGYAMGRESVLNLRQ